jgi:ABC-type nickel/cobalt efflux system permease component RcnA
VGDTTGTALLSVALATALLHTLIPDHWLPFVLIGRAQAWSLGVTAAVAGVSAAIHAALSIVLALGALAVGAATAGAIGGTLERVGAWLLVTFGLVYAAWAWGKGGHFHPGGERLHRAAAEPCDGREGPGHPAHLHYHADDGWIRGSAGRGRWWLAAIVGINPCVLLLPIVLASAEHGATAVVLVSIAYAVPTVALMIGLSVLGVSGARWLPIPGAARYMEVASGLLVAGVGALVALA